MSKRGIYHRTTSWKGRTKKRCQHVISTNPIVKKCPKRAKFGNYCRKHWREHAD